MLLTSLKVSESKINRHNAEINVLEYSVFHIFNTTFFPNNSSVVLIHEFFMILYFMEKNIPIKKKIIFSEKQNE